MTLSEIIQMAMNDIGASVGEVELTERDIPGAYLDSPLERHNNEALRWWLLCRNIQVPTSMTKAQLIARFVLFTLAVN